MLSLSLAMLFWSMDFYPGGLWVSASWRGTGILWGLLLVQSVSQSHQCEAVVQT